MSQVRIGKWGNNLAIRVPYDIARATGLSDGEQVEIETQNGDIVIHRPAALASAAAQAAAEEILAEREDFTLGEVSIRELIDEGRRG